MITDGAHVNKTLTNRLLGHMTLVLRLTSKVNNVIKYSCEKIEVNKFIIGETSYSHSFALVLAQLVVLTMDLFWMLVCWCQPADVNGQPISP